MHNVKISIDAHSSVLHCYLAYCREIQFFVCSRIFVQVVVGCHSRLEKVDCKTSIVVERVATDEVPCAVVVGYVNSASSVVGNDVGLFGRTANYCLFRTLRDSYSVESVAQWIAVNVNTYVVAYYYVAVGCGNIYADTNLSVARNNVAIHYVLVRNAVDDNSSCVCNCLATCIVCADEVVLQEVVVSTIVVEEHTVADISRNNISLCVGIAAYAVAIRTIVEQHAVGVANRLGASNIGSNVIADNYILCGSSSEKGQSVVGVTRYYVSFFWRSSANCAILHCTFHAHAVVVGQRVVAFAV